MIHQTPNFFRNPNHNINICVIGAGGTGSLILARLARLDYALKQSDKAGLNVTVYDHDTVEAHNIGRQLFTVNDIGENKAFALVSKINRAFLTDFKAVTTKFNTEKGLKNQNIFITAVDTADFRVDFHSYFKGFDTINKSISEERCTYYWLDFGNTKNSGQCILGSNFIEQNNQSALFNGVLPTVVDMFPDITEMDSQDIQGASCSYQSKLHEQNLFTNDSLCAIGMHLLYELLTQGHITNHGFFLNLDNLKSNPIKIPLKKTMHLPN